MTNDQGYTYEFYLPLFTLSYIDVYNAPFEYTNKHDKLLPKVMHTDVKGYLVPI